MTMNNSLSWQYDKFQQIGTDYSNKAEVDIYKKSHASFRDIVADSIKILDRLEIKGSDSVIDFGAGTGTFVIQAAKRCAKVYAVDVSQAMLDFAESRATQSGLSNIRFHHSGFLTYEHVDQPVDAVFTTFAFHHLPDFWKGIALKRLNRMLKAGGQLYIHDVIIAEDNAIENIDALIEKLADAGGLVMRDDTERHFREEYSTYEWVMDGFLSRSGFTIKSKRIVDGVCGVA